MYGYDDLAMLCLQILLLRLFVSNCKCVVGSKAIYMCLNNPLFASFFVRHRIVLALYCDITVVSLCLQKGNYGG